MVYVHQKKEWPNWKWSMEIILPLLSDVRYLQGRLLGQMQLVGFDLRLEAELESRSLDILQSNAIEGNILNPEEVRSSVARCLGIQTVGMREPTHYVNGIVDMMMDATHNYEKLLPKDRLFGWHCALFPTGYSGIEQITVGNWRTDADGPMRVVSGGMGIEKIHFEAPPASKVIKEMEVLLHWIETSGEDHMMQAAIVHLWFVTIHPFDDGNGRIGRAISDLLLARSDRSKRRFYSLSNQIEKDKKEYYRQLEMAQRGTLDITEWLAWLLGCVRKSLIESSTLLKTILQRSNFWQIHKVTIFNKRQKKMLHLLLGDFFGKLKTAKWAKLMKCSHDTANRDIQDLISKGVLKRNEEGGRSTSYALTLPNDV
jgi:Fic family protein